MLLRRTKLISPLRILRSCGNSSILLILMSAFLILILSPVFIVTPLYILLSMGAPVLFKQQRIGHKNREFEIYKFRSMREKSKKYSSDRERITKFGRLLRISRIDEFPQLLNILRGDMSFVGPRPLLPDYLPHYTLFEKRRHEVRPGLSGLSQVSSSYPAWEEQFAYDVEYVDHLCMKLDITILFKTVTKIIRPTRKLITGNAQRLRFDAYRMEQKKC